MPAQPLLFHRTCFVDTGRILRCCPLERRIRPAPIRLFDPRKTRMLTFKVVYIAVAATHLCCPDPQVRKGSVTLSSTVETQILRKTSLNGLHRRLGAKMVDFGGWDMPVEYPSSGGLVKEHLALRSGVGVFDVSHMGDIRIRG